MSNINDEKLIYEHKCRKCGTVKEMFHTYRQEVLWTDFAVLMQDMVLHPRSEECEICNRNTVHDIISYSGPFKT